MTQVPLRDYFAATADVDWIYSSPVDVVAARADVNPPPANPTAQQLANFYVRAEIKWRWKYADLMLKGKD